MKNFYTLFISFFSNFVLAFKTSFQVSKEPELKTKEVPCLYCKSNSTPAIISCHNYLFSSDYIQQNQRLGPLPTARASPLFTLAGGSLIVPQKKSNQNSRSYCQTMQISVHEYIYKNHGANIGNYPLYPNLIHPGTFSDLHNGNPKLGKYLQWYFRRLWWAW